jgi:hypothetical protein
MTVVRGHWFPAAVTLPGQQQPWSRCYVIAADDGLHVFKQRSERASWYSPVEWATTSLPTTDKQARRGFDVHTDAGLVVVTMGTRCGCGALGSWAGPTWARAERVGA